MNKLELVEVLAEKLQLPKSKSEEILNTLVDIITITLTKGGEVTITGFGTFSSRRREARMGVNPQHPSERIQVPAVTVPKFKAGKGLKDALKAR
ncbi:MAG: HU family DNA-binding protein [bacterium]